MERILKDQLPGGRFIGVSQQRSRQMASIRGRGNKSTELMLVALLREQRIKGWRRNLQLPGKPDFSFPKQRVAIFVDGCFWHGCPHCYKRPRTREQYWSAKIIRNQKRDRKVCRILRASGWRVFRIWEHELKAPAKCLSRLLRLTKNGEPESQDAMARFGASLEQ
jgi:DNA mismatch endonuclease, patch repair protein